ncbi:MAG: PIN domain-containing protein [Patescibacteria group bacterium]|nr:PIN domain-containing protein [Patescibacteria group bacterium]
MGKTIVVDANVLCSALLGGKPGSILFDERFQFVTAEYTLNEVKKYVPMLADKLSLPNEYLHEMLGGLPVFVYDDAWYASGITEAERMIGHIDAKDVPILALALRLGAPLWSQDAHFDQCGYLEVIKTRHFFEH